MLATFHGELHAFVLDVAYGRILSRPALPPRDRELLAVAALAALQQTPQLVAHGRGAIHFGADPAALREALHVALAPDDDAIERALAKIMRGKRDDTDSS
jgi:AhpD family alkylhydroperoxidase